jgi:hypothetical protein
MHRPAWAIGANQRVHARRAQRGVNAAVFELFGGASQFEQQAEFVFGWCLRQRPGDRGHPQRLNPRLPRAPPACTFFGPLTAQRCNGATVQRCNGATVQE